MVVEFLLKQKNQLLKEFQNQKSTKELNGLLAEIKQAIQIGNFDDAESQYSKIGEIYKTLTDDIKKQVFKKCIEVHKRIQTKNRIVEELKVEEPQVQGPTGSPEFELIKTGVPGFDDLIEDGIPKGSNILVSGGPGSGKTTFTSQLLMYNAAQGLKCLYMSFEESDERLKKHLRNYGWDPDKYIKQGNLMIRRYDPFLISRSVEALLAEARGELVIQIDKTKGLIPDDFSPDLIVVDSLSAIAAAFAEREEAYRIYIEQLFRSFERISVTTFLITECEEGSGKLSKTGVEEFLADGVIAFYNMKHGNTRINATEVVKLRGTGHKKKIVPFSFIRGKGIEVYPLQEIFLG